MLVISRGRGAVFIHVPKTGGESIGAALMPESPLAMMKHAPASGIRGPVGKALVFGFVRNPWDRMVSLYSWMAQTELSWFDREVIRCAGFKRWLLDNGACPDPPAGRHWTEAGMAPPLTRRPQTWWLDGCAFVGRFESLQEDFDTACDLIGIQRRRLPHENASERASYQDYYDAETETAVAEWFAPDIERWGYVFDAT